MKLSNLLYAGGLVLLATACEKELPKFSDEECMLTFHYGDGLTTAGVKDGMGRGSHSFKFCGRTDERYCLAEGEYYG